MLIKYLIVQISLVIVRDCILLLKMMFLLLARRWWVGLWDVMVENFLLLLAEWVIDLLLLLLMELLLLSWCGLGCLGDVMLEHFLPLGCESLWVPILVQVRKWLNLLDWVCPLWMLLDVIVVPVARAWTCWLVILNGVVIVGWVLLLSVVEIRLGRLHLEHLLLLRRKVLQLWLVELKFHGLEDFLSFLESWRLFLELLLRCHLLVLSGPFDLVPYSATSLSLYWRGLRYWWGLDQWLLMYRYRWWQALTRRLFKLLRSLFRRRYLPGSYLWNLNNTLRVGEFCRLLESLVCSLWPSTERRGRLRS